MGSSLSKSSATATPAVSSARRSPYRKASTNPAKITTKIVVETTKPKLVSRPTEKKRGTFTAAIDQGTTSTRFIIFDSNGTPKANHQVEFEQLYPHSG
jgi:glycerol kinase